MLFLWLVGAESFELLFKTPFVSSSYFMSSSCFLQKNRLHKPFSRKKHRFDASYHVDQFSSHYYCMSTMDKANATNIAHASNNLNLLYKIFLRWSPLIGGPSFLPLHVEVILFHQATTPSISTIPSHLHRLDFLPQTPTDPQTLFKLLTLQSVSSQIRHRMYQVENQTSADYTATQSSTNPRETFGTVDSNTTTTIPNQEPSSPSSLLSTSSPSIYYSTSKRYVSWERIQKLLFLESSDTSSSSSFRRKGHSTFILPLESKLLSITHNQIIPHVLIAFLFNHTSSSSTTTTMQGYGQKYTSLHLLWNNCYNFAYDLLSTL